MESHGGGPNLVFFFNTPGDIGEHFLEEVILNFNITFYLKKWINAHGIIFTGSRDYITKCAFLPPYHRASQVPAL